jgi:hypothetical protein
MFGEARAGLARHVIVNQGTPAQPVRAVRSAAGATFKVRLYHEDYKWARLVVGRNDFERPPTLTTDSQIRNLMAGALKSPDPGELHEYVLHSFEPLDKDDPKSQGDVEFEIPYDGKNLTPGVKVVITGAFYNETDADPKGQPLVGKYQHIIGARKGPMQDASVDYELDLP